MKNRASLLLSLMIPLFGIAQPEIKNAEDFQIGTVLKFKLCDTTGMNPGNIGSNQTWDFSNLKSKPDTMTEWIVSPGSTPYKDKYPGANQVEKCSNGNYIYVNKEKSQSLFVGYVAPGLNISNPKPLLFAKRPVSYPAKFSDNFTDKFSTSGMDFSGGGTVTIEADGYGNLILPNKTYKNVLRIKITRMQADTIKQYGSTTNMSVITYAWFDGQHASALLKMSAIKAQGYSMEELEYLLSEEDK